MPPNKPSTGTDQLICTIPIRLGSRRLPGKSLLEINGRPFVEHLVRRLKGAKAPDTIVICTTSEPADDVLVSWAERLGVALYRGDRDDLLRRFLGACDAYRAAFVVNVDGDDVLMDPDQVDEVADLLKQTGADFVSLEGLPLGSTPIGYRVATLRTIVAEKAEKDTATGWGRFFVEDPRFRTLKVPARDPALHHPEFRLTLDYPEDHRLFEALFKELDRQGRPQRLRDAIDVLLAHPEIRELNRAVAETYWANFRRDVEKSKTSGQAEAP